MSNYPKISIDTLPAVPPELQLLRDSIEQNLRKLEAYANTRSFPVGTVLGNPTDKLWDGFLICDGSAFDTVKYRELFEFLGSANLPDYRGMFLVGKNSADTDFDVVGDTGGSKSGVGSHSHTQDAHDHTDAGHTHFHNHGGSTDSGGTHFHSANLANLNWTSNSTHTHSGHPGYACEGAEPNNGIPVAVPVNVDSGGAHAHGFTTLDDAEVGISDNQPTTATNQNAGTGSGNVPPFRVVNWMIKT